MAEHNATALQQLLQQQRAFAAHIRDPAGVTAPPDVPAARMQVYRDLFFNNMVKFLGGFFPVLVSTLGAQRWQMLVRDFYRDHSSQTPLFPELPREFISYLQNERALAETDPAWLSELAHYEWVESAAMLAADEPVPACLAGVDPLRGAAVFAHPAWLLSYRFPVHEIGPDNADPAPTDSPHFFVVFRDSGDTVRFLKLNPVSARLFELLQLSPECCGQDALLQVAAELQHPDPEQVAREGTAILEQWRNQGLLLGSRTISA